jgi:anti-sigma factor RsiW
MSCSKFTWKVGPYVDGELSIPERDAVESHLERCPDCKQLALDFRALDRLAGHEVPPVSPAEWSAMLQRVLSEPRLAISLPRQRRWELLAPVLSIAALVILTVLLGPNLVRSPPAGTEAGVPTAQQEPEDAVRSGTPRWAATSEDQRDLEIQTPESGGQR